MRWRLGLAVRSGVGAACGSLPPTDGPEHLLKAFGIINDVFGRLYSLVDQFLKPFCDDACEPQRGETSVLISEATAVLHRPFSAPKGEASKIGKLRCLTKFGAPMHAPTWMAILSNRYRAYKRVICPPKRTENPTRED